MNFDRLPQPNDNNRWYHYSDSDTVIVFVHGVLSDSRSCWLAQEEDSKQPVCYWPELIRSDPRLNGIGIYLSGYHTAVDSGDFPIQQCANEVYSYLKTADPQARPPVMSKRTIVFVCHSMGGIVARYLLCEQSDAFKDKRIGLVLIASPSYGSQLAHSLDEVIRLYNHAQGKQLKWGNAILRDLDQRFKNLKESDRIPELFGVEFFENRFLIRTRWLPLFTRTKVVTEESAVRYFGYAKQVGGSNHSSICKPRSMSDTVHQYLLEFLQDKHLLPASAPQSEEKPGDGRTAPPRHAGPGELGTAAFFRAGSSVQFNFITPGAVTAPLRPDEPFAATLPPAQFASPLSLMLAGHFPVALGQAIQEKPRIEDLFEVITDPEEVYRALFQTESSAGLVPYDTAYVNARDQVNDVQDALETALRRSKGRLLVCGPRGIGKTREIAELARAACAARWKILVARHEGNSRLGPLIQIPSELLDARLLIVIDNLHLRVSTGAEHLVAPYLERLDVFLDWFDRQLPGNVRVIASTRDEPRFQKMLELRVEPEHWQGFGLFRLPPLTDDGLQQILSGLALHAKVPVDPADIPKLIENSDRTAATVFLNVDLARQRRVALTPGAWKPTQGEPWRLRFVAARAEHPGVDPVCQALFLLTQAGLPARLPYVHAVARASGAAETQIIVDALVGEGLLRLRQGILAPFSNEQLPELLSDTAAASTKLEALAQTIEQAVNDACDHSRERIDDLLAFAVALSQQGDTVRAERIATRAVELDTRRARAYRVRAAIRFERRDLPGLEFDLTQVIALGEADPDSYFGRAAIRNLLGNYTEALDDLDCALRLGRDDGAIHAQRGTAFFQLRRWADADGAMSDAILRGERTPTFFFIRGMARFQLNDLAGAQLDLSNAIERGVDFTAAANELSRFEKPDSKPVSDAGERPSDGAAFVHALRGITRLRLGDNSGAEADFSTAITGGAHAQLSAFVDTVRQSTLPLLARVKGELKHVAPLTGPGVFYQLRGAARLNLGNFTDAQDDFDAAVARGNKDSAVYFGRAAARLRLENFAGAELDATTAIEGGNLDAYELRAPARLRLGDLAGAEMDYGSAIAHRSAPTDRHAAPSAGETNAIGEAARAATAGLFFMRGCLRFDLQKHVEAEQDFSAAEKLGCELPALFTFRGLARLSLEKLAEAEADAAEAFKNGAQDVPAHSLRAAVRLLQERYAEAEPDLSAAIALQRDDAWVRFQRGRAYQRLERFAEAEQDYLAALKFGSEALRAAGSDITELLVSLGRSRLAQHKLPEAIDDFTAAIAAGRDNAYTRYCLGVTHQEIKNYAQAEREYDRALAHGPQALAFASRGQLRLLRGNFSGAESDLSEAITLDTNDAEILHSRALCRYGQKNYAAALADCDAALAIAPETSRTVGARVMVQLRRRDFAAAAKDCERLYELNPEDAETQGCYGALTLARGDVSGAQRYLCTAAEGDSSWDYWRGLAALLDGHFDEACQAYRRAANAHTPADNLLALDELEFYLNQYPEKTTSAESQSAVVRIRAQLGITA